MQTLVAEAQAAWQKNIANTMLVEMQPTKSPAVSEKSSNVIANMECDDEELSPAQISAYSRPENDYQTLWTSLQKKLKLRGFSDIPEPLYLNQFPKYVSGIGFFIDASHVQKSPITASQSSTIISHPVPQGNPIQSPLTIVVPSQNTGSVVKNYASPSSSSNIVPTGSKSISLPRTYSNAPTSSANKNVTPSVVSKPKPANNAKEVPSVNKLTDKTYPSLIVVARPSLQIKKMTPLEMKIACQERTTVDNKVKQVLLYTPAKFTEWLLQQGLVKSQLVCSTHVDDDFKPLNLKLGMYSDASKYPHSGGYVWLSDCCKQNISVFKGSIFDGAPYPPNILLKLIYHWACQTSVMNIVAWVKVNSFFIKTFFTSLRAVCTAAVHEKYEKLGGENVKVEVGVISLGTTTSHGGGRQVKIEVLGMMETESKLIRLQAIEPSPDIDKNSKKKFKTVLAPMEQWVHKNSTILTDFTIDKSTLLSMGYKNIIQSSNLDQNKKIMKNSNINVMEYLKKVVPRMFQNTLAFLSRQMIQQFLDELIWREKFGYVSAKAFDSLIEHLAEQTKLSSGDFLLPRLQRIALNPFKNWKYCNWKINCASDETMDVSELELISSKLQKAGDNASTEASQIIGRKRSADDPQPMFSKSPLIDLTKSSDPIALESFYYGTIPASKDVEDRGGLSSMNCVICPYKCNDIIAMMKHLVSHAFHESSDKKDAGKNPMCRYCLRTFVTDYWLESHLLETHFRFKNKTGLMCLICEEKFRDRTTLILHMHRSHKELELPYKCQICHFRTSQHTAMVDHFYNAHHNGKTLMCPFCLKAVDLASKGKIINQNQFFFLNHIQKHRRKVLSKKCNKCVLWFVQKGLLVDHQNSDHSTCKELENVQRFPAPADGALMPRPKSSNQSTEESLKLIRDPAPNESLFVKSSDLKSIQFIIPEETPTCSECESSFNEEDHFPGEIKCKQCKFVTNCYNAIIDHITVFHDLRGAEPLAGKQMGLKPFTRVTDLNKPMFCCCGFECSSGDKLAHHLLSCKKKSAYPSRMIANQNVSTTNSGFEDDPDDPDEVSIMEENNPNTSFDLRSIRKGRTVVD